MTSHQLHMRRDSVCLQQRTNVARIAGQHDVRWSDQQRYVRVDDIGRASLREQLAYPLAVIPAQCFDSHARQYSCEIGLLAAITPDLTDNRGTRPQRRPLLLEHAQLSTHLPVTPVDSNQGSGIEYRFHATSGRGARPSRDAAASSSAWVKEPASDSHASKAAPSSSFLSLSAAASLSQADTLTPWRSAARRTPSPRSGGIVTENLSTCAMHTIISHTLVLTTAGTAAHPAVVLTVALTMLQPPSHQACEQVCGLPAGTPRGTSAPCNSWRARAGCPIAGRGWERRPAARTSSGGCNR